ncbi:MAG: UPF0262 family protein [Rhodospirillales bacterium]|jgi:uncharacterized protein (UPF0262 family)|nr:UPF0262 family protein [Rhodospirillales bacterium]
MAPLIEAEGKTETGGETPPTQRITRMTLAQAHGIRLSPQLEQERRSALYDLIEDNQFALASGAAGPYCVHLAIEGERLVFDVRSEDDQPLGRFALPLLGLKRIIKEYFLVCDSYLQAIKTVTPSRIEAIDMGRRSLHNEGAESLRERLAIFAAVDHDTARRLFTLICVLLIRK